MKNKDYCDHCGKVIPTRKSYAVSNLLVNIDSANVGESAILCKACYFEIKKEEQFYSMTEDEINKLNKETK